MKSLFFAAATLLPLASPLAAADTTVLLLAGGNSTMTNDELDGFVFPYISHQIGNATIALDHIAYQQQVVEGVQLGGKISVDYFDYLDFSEDAGDQFYADAHLMADYSWQMLNVATQISHGLTQFDDARQQISTTVAAAMPVGPVFAKLELGNHFANEHMLARDFDATGVEAGFHTYQSAQLSAQGMFAQNWLAMAQAGVTRLDDEVAKQAELEQQWQVDVALGFGFNF